MGMDVMGNNATSERGSYFRNNVWWWHPLAGLITQQYPDIADKCEHWHSNDGDGLNADDSYKLAQLLQTDIDSGALANYETDYRNKMASLPRTDCTICDATGIRTDELGVREGFTTKELSTENQILTGRILGWCNGCDGAGTCESFEGNYGFSVENVQEFVEFLRECGGFSIH